MSSNNDHVDPPPPYPGVSNQAFEPGTAYYQAGPAAPPPYKVSETQAPVLEGNNAERNPLTFSTHGSAGNYSHSSVVISQPQMPAIQTFQDIPVRCVCPHCQAEILTATHYDNGTMTWVVCCVLCSFGLACGCCLIPFFSNSAKDVVHTCPNCKQLISRFERLRPIPPRSYYLRNAANVPQRLS
ncbi:cell death-inducing p53-target protein 1 homolog [Aplysia californica]|uniref:Cell death-inducing p53-target protein 1 homolog n=1 Tax=Aplysia californica TaxID=6500 RepID=A0ABM1ACZ8_APLCA|nr:cell death-inducing p53-target protein 1 homolog [Aplysia californica]XP_012945334.1 cell death-inducing p53-target protein 1 homolog [Aplysia californica]